MISMSGDRMLEKLVDGDQERFRITKPSVIWNFSKEQLEAEIARLETELAEKRSLLADCEKLQTTT
jgi:sugar-specific transcriptional regulator TrmB